MLWLQRPACPDHLVLEGRFTGIDQPGHVALRRLGPSLGGPPPPIGPHQHVHDPNQNEGLKERDHRVHEALPHPASGFREIAQSRADRPTTNKALDPWPPRVAYVGNRGDVMGTGSRHGEAPWHRKLEGPARPGNCAKTIHSDAPAFPRRRQPPSVTAVCA